MESPFISLKEAGKVGIKKEPTRKGLERLNMSASAQFSPGEMATMIREIRKHTNGPIYDMDLRGETHGFSQGMAISWFGENNWGNIGRNAEEALKDEETRLKDIEGKKITTYIKKDLKSKTSPKSLEALTVLSERQMAQILGIQYMRFNCVDHLWPKPQEIDQFINFTKTLPENAWLHFHCSAGRGRTGAFMALYDMMHNVPEVSMEDIVARQHMLGASYLLLIEKGKWKEEWQTEKVKMLKLLYQYVSENKGSQYAVSWSEWLKKKNL